MNIHKNAKTTAKMRALFVKRRQAGETPRHSCWRRFARACFEVAEVLQERRRGRSPRPDQPAASKGSDIASRETVPDRVRHTAARKAEKALEYLHLAVDDHSPLAYFEIRPDETRRSCLRSCLTFLFNALFNALRFFRDHGVKVLRGMTDKGASFRSLSSRQGVANAENQAQAHHTLSAKNQQKGRTLRADLLAGWAKLQSSSATFRHQRKTPYLKDLRP